MGKDAIESSIIIDLFKEEYELDFEALNLQWIKKYFRVEEEDRKLSARVVLKIGPIKAKFKGKVSLDLSNGPKKYSLTGEGDGGVAGFAKGGADVELIEDGDETILKYVAKSEVKGKIAQLGSRLILSTGKKLSKTFFENFRQYMEKDKN